MMWRDGAAVKQDAASGSPERGRPALELAAPIHIEFNRSPVCLLTHSRAYATFLQSVPTIGLQMKAVSVRELKNNPSAALRAAREDPVMVLNRHQPEAVLVHLSDDSLLSEPGMRQAIATSLFRDGSLSLGLAARFSGLGVAGFIDHASRLGVPVVTGTAETVRDDAESVEGWRSNSS